MTTAPSPFERLSRERRLAIVILLNLAIVVAQALAGVIAGSLGLLAEQDYTVRRALADYDAPTLHRATFGISLEPTGGSPTGQPTGPVVHGKLIQTTPAAFPGGTP